MSHFDADLEQPGWDLGQYIVDEYRRRRMDWNASALARAAQINRGTLIYIVKGFRGDGTPVEPQPNTLRQIARGLALGDSNPDAAEIIYERLMDLAGYLPHVSPQLRKVETQEEYDLRWKAREEELRRSFEERIEQTHKVLEELWRPRESA